MTAPVDAALCGRAAEVQLIALCQAVDWATAQVTLQQTTCCRAYVESLYSCRMTRVPQCTVIRHRMPRAETSDHMRQLLFFEMSATSKPDATSCHAFSSVLSLC